MYSCEDVEFGQVANIRTKKKSQQKLAAGVADIPWPMYGTNEPMMEAVGHRGHKPQFFKSKVTVASVDIHIRVYDVSNKQLKRMAQERSARMRFFLIEETNRKTQKKFLRLHLHPCTMNSNVTHEVRLVEQAHELNHCYTTKAMCGVGIEATPYLHAA